MSIKQSIILLIAVCSGVIIVYSCEQESSVEAPSAMQEEDILLVLEIK